MPKWRALQGKKLASGRIAATHKHAYWQFLPDELISPFILPELPDNLPSVKSRQKDPTLALTWLALLASPLPQADLQAWHLCQKPLSPAKAASCPSPLGPGGGSAAGTFLPLKESEAGRWPLGTCQNKKP